MTIDNDSKEVLNLFGFTHSIGLVLGEEGLIKNLDLVMRVAIGGVKLEEMKKIEQLMFYFLFLKLSICMYLLNRLVSDLDVGFGI